MLVLENVRLEVGEEEDVLASRAAERLGVAREALGRVEVVHRALDARRKRDIHWSLHLGLEVPEVAERVRLLEAGLVKDAAQSAREPLDAAILDGVARGSRPLPAPPVVIGSGPGGLFAAWLLAREGYAPVVLERGPSVEKRVRQVNAFDQGGPHDPESNILFGEGGAGTFSDGKLTCRVRTPLVSLVHDLLVAAKAPPDIKVHAKPHVGTDRLRAVLVFLRRELERMGTTFRFGTRVDELLLDGEGRVRALRLAGGEELRAAAVVLAIGHSARDTYEMLARQGVLLDFKPFQLGLRIEHPQGLVDRAQYGPLAGKLPVAEYSLNDKRQGVFSFCMCPGGTVMASISEAEHLCTNGMSRRLRDSGWANSGLVLTVSAKQAGGKHALAGVELQRRLERRGFELGGRGYEVPAQRVTDFLAGRATKGAIPGSYPRAMRGTDLRHVLPSGSSKLVVESLLRFDHLMPGYAGPEGVLVGPESRGSSPVRIPRQDVSRESLSTPGLYPVGEGAGYAGGIMSAAVDGLRSAAALISVWAPA